jgi:hypothetical protein
VVKLASGHFLSPERVEAVVLAACPDVVACVVTPTRAGDAVVAVCATSGSAAAGDPGHAVSPRVIAEACRGAGVPPSNWPAFVIQEPVGAWTAAKCDRSPCMRVCVCVRSLLLAAAAVTARVRRGVMCCVCARAHVCAGPPTTACCAVLLGATVAA